MKAIIAVLLFTLITFAQNTREYYVSGKLRLEGATSDRGDKVGTWNEFYESGRLKATTLYAYGTLVSKIEYALNGKVARETRYEGGYLSYEKTTSHESVYVKGVIRYLDGVSQWSYSCDTLTFLDKGNEIQQQQLCGYRTAGGTKAGTWYIKTLAASPDVMTLIDTTRSYSYVVYDTTSGEFIRYVRGSFSREYKIRDMKMGGELRGILEKNTSGFTHSIYSGWASDGHLKFSSSLRWSSDHNYVYSSINPSQHLSVYNCDMQEYMPNKACHPLDTYLHHIELFEESYKRYK